MGILTLKKKKDSTHFIYFYSSIKICLCYKYWILNDHNDSVVTMSFIV